MLRVRPQFYGMASDQDSLSDSRPAHEGFLEGQLLIAMPGIGDPRFERALILVCAHDAEHAMGLAINRPVDGLTLQSLLERLELPAPPGAETAPVLLGGPVERERGFVLHTPDYGQDDATLRIEGGFSLTATRQALEALACEHPPRLARLALGYAGWGPGQLEQEIRHNVWLTCPADEALVFDADHDTKWSRALQKIGVDPHFLTAQAGRA